MILIKMVFVNVGSVTVCGEYLLEAFSGDIMDPRGNFEIILKICKVVLV